MVGTGVTPESTPESDEVGLPVVLVDGDEASGMATMLAELLRDNLRDFPRRARVAARTRGALVLTASDRDLSITLSFGPDRIEITDGALEGAPRMSGSWLEMSRVCSGRVSPLRAVAGRDLKLIWGRRIWVVPAGGFVLSVPASFYGDSNVARNRKLIALAIGVTAVLCLAVVLQVRS